MVIIAPLFLISISYLFGVLLKRVLCDDDGRLVRTCLIGTFFVMILWSVFVLVGTTIIDDFRLISRLYSITLLILMAISAWINKKKIVADFEVKKSVSVLSVVIIVLAIMTSAIVFLVVEPDTYGDSSIETVNTVLTTNTFYGYNPLTGKAYGDQFAMPFIDRVRVLPFFYAYVSNLLGARSLNIVEEAMPLWILILSLFSYYVWVDAFFEEKDKVKRTLFFTCGIIALNLMGAFSMNSAFYYQTLKGFSGETFCYSILIPFAVYECFEGMNKRKWQSGIYLLMAIICTFLVTKVQTGIVPFAIVLLLSFVVSIGYRIRRLASW